jgi:hypothetical protein
VIQVTLAAAVDFGIRFLVIGFCTANVFQAVGAPGGGLANLEDIMISYA